MKERLPAFVRIPCFTADESLIKVERKNSFKVSNHDTTQSYRPVIVPQYLQCQPCNWYKVAHPEGGYFVKCGKRCNEVSVLSNGTVIKNPYHGWIHCDNHLCGPCPPGYCDPSSDRNHSCSGRVNPRDGRCGNPL
jgi:hypothetical protein